jgi:hypothetical protein
MPKEKPPFSLGKDCSGGGGGATAAGCGILDCEGVAFNPIRIAMSALLCYILSRKADDNEKLLKMGPKKEAYEIYEKKVRTKFIPLLWPESKSVFTPWLRTYDDY